MRMQVESQALVNNKFIKKEANVPFLKKETVSLFSDDEKQEVQNSEKDSKKKNVLIKVGIGITIAAGLAMFAYFKRDAIKDFLKDTKLNKMINEGLNNAKEAKKIPLQPVTQETNGIMEEVIKEMAPRFDEVADNFTKDKGFLKSTIDYAQKRVSENPNIVSEMLSSSDSTQIIKSSIELSGTGPTKIAQILSNDADIMSKLDNQFPNIADALRKTKTQCNPGRTIEEAVQFLQESFPNSGYVLEKELGVGSIGATYLATNSTGEKVAIKMIKKGVSIESLQAEEKLFTDALSKTFKGQKFDKVKGMVGDLYKNWREELNLTQSLKYNRTFTDGATRYSVAQIKEVSKNGQCLVMEMADGIQMSKLMKILEDYKINPNNFNVKYADVIEKAPWLANPEKVMSELPESIIKSFSEQFLFLKNGKSSLMHGDPHTGNFFITMNKKGKLIPEFIDTDNCVIRTCAQIKDDVSMFANYLVGNSKKVAEYYVNQCGCSVTEKAKYVELISEELKKTIFNGKCNITSYVNVQENINAILKKFNLSLSLEKSTALKSQLQFIKVIGASSKISGRGLDIFTLMKDIPQALWGMIKSGVNPFGCIKEALIYAFKNPQKTLTNAGQFFI